MVFPFKMIDLTHEIVPNMPYWRGISPFTRVVEFESYDPKADVQFSTHKIIMMEGSGTHI